VYIVLAVVWLVVHLHVSLVIHRLFFIKEIVLLRVLVVPGYLQPATAIFVNHVFQLLLDAVLVILQGVFNALSHIFSVLDNVAHA